MTQPDPPSPADAIQALLTCETRGVLSHLTQAKPYLTPATLQSWRDIQTMSRRGAQRAAELARLLAILGQGDHPTAFPLAVAYSDYLTVPGLWPPLLAETRRQIAAYERALSLAGANPALAPTLRSLLDQHRAFLERLLLAHQIP
jgi:hypothetical protein